MKELSFIGICLCFLSTNIFSQNQKSCGFDKVHQEMLRTNPEYQNKTAKFNNSLINNYQKSAATLLRIPVVVHVMHLGETIGSGTNLSDQDIKDGIQEVNERFRKVAGGIGDGAGVDVEIEFALAVRDESGNCTDGIVRVDMSGNGSYSSGGVGSGGLADATLKATSRWLDEDYYNIYVVSEIDNANCFTGGGYTAGYAYFASSHGNSIDGTIILACSFKNSSTLTHELGHSLNLYHTFEGGSCSEGSCSGSGDLCCDTPPHPGSNTNCGTPECSSTQQVENYMDYTGDACQDMFTADQTTRMRSAVTGQRASYLGSNGNMSLVPPAAPTAEFNADAAVVCNGATISFIDNSYCIPNSFGNDAWSGMSFSWTFNDGVNTPITSTLQNPSITFTTNGVYDVTHQVTNASGTHTLTKTDYIVVSGAPAGGACTPPGIQNSGYFDYAVNNVDFNSISNNTGPVENGNQDYTCTYSTVVYRDSIYNLSITVGAGGGQTAFYAVYIDYNNNGTLNDAGETVMSGSLSAGSSPTTFSSNITIPTSATQYNSLRMRVMNDQAGLSGPCDNLFTGESEDYTVYIGDPPAGLSIELISFEASKNMSKVHLSWFTAEAENFSHFEIEKSSDYKLFKKIAEKEYTIEDPNYYYIDNSPFQGSNYYRLKLIDKDQKYSYSEIKKVVFDENNISVSPNPFKETIQLSGLKTEANIKVVNLMGQTILNEFINENQTSFNTSDLPDGTYIVTIQTENNTFVEKLIKSTK